MKVGAVVLVCLAVAGCGIARQKEEKAAWDRAKAEGNECASKYRKFTMEWAHCTNAAQERLVSRVSTPGDYSRLILTTRVALSEKVTTGKMTYAEADMALAQIDMNAMTAVSSRQSAARAAQAAEDTASEISRPVSCNRLGNTVRCY